MSASDPTATSWCCGDCDTWNDVGATSCMVCEAQVRDEWLQRPATPVPEPSRPAQIDPSWQVRPTPTATERSIDLNVPLDPGAPPAVASPDSPPPSIAALLARANEPAARPAPLPPSIVITAVVVAVVALFVLALIALR